MPPRMALRALTLKIKLAVKTAGIIKMGSVSFFLTIMWLMYQTTSAIRAATPASIPFKTATTTGLSIKFR